MIDMFLGGFLQGSSVWLMAKAKAKAKDASIRRHADNQELSDEQLKVIIAELMPQ